MVLYSGKLKVFFGCYRKKKYRQYIDSYCGVCRGKKWLVSRWVVMNTRSQEPDAVYKRLVF